jgi:Uma2 family endonuclease
MAGIDAMETIESMETPARKRRPRVVVYPTGDGKPLGEDESHVRETLNCIQFLQFWFRNRPDIYVIGNNFVYWNEGHPRDRVSPDCYVVFGVEKRIRPSYKSWEEDGKLPDVVFEFTSKSTMRQDIDRKFALFGEVWKSREYFLFDPNREYLKPPLQGYTLVDGQYVPLELVDNRLHSEQLGLDLVMNGSYLRFYDPVLGEYIPTLAESAEQTLSARRSVEDERVRFEDSQRLVREARVQLDAARHRTSEAEAENARLRAEVEALQRRLGEQDE